MQQDEPPPDKQRYLAEGASVLRRIWFFSKWPYRLSVSTAQPLPEGSRPSSGRLGLKRQLEVGPFR